MNTTTENAFAFELDHVCKAYGGTRAVDDLCLRIPTGAKLGFLGPNGAGKTTTIRMLMGLTRPSSGAVKTLGLDPRRDHLALKRRVGYVPEAHMIHRWMRVGEVLWMCSRLYPTWNLRWCDELLSRFGLRRETKVGALSKGMLAKLTLLVALGHEPQVLILDEPTSGLDPIIRDDFLDGILATLCERELTVLFSSHILSDVQRIAEHIAIVHQGQLLAFCDTDSLLERTKRIRAVLEDGGSPPAPPDNVIWQSLDHREWLLTVRNFSPDTVSRLRADNVVKTVDVLDLNLEQIFKDYIRGRGMIA